MFVPFTAVNCYNVLYWFIFEKNIFQKVFFWVIQPDMEWPEKWASVCSVIRSAVDQQCVRLC